MEEVLDEKQIEEFVNEGLIRINNALPTYLADEALSILCKDLPWDRNDPSSWTMPVVRLGMYTDEPFIKAANTPILHKAFDQLVGPGKWDSCKSMGTFPVRFPSAVDPGDTGWHVDASFPGSDPNNYFEWRINKRSRGRGLLMLFLFSDVGEKDAPTKIKTGSHLDVAKILEPHGEWGLSAMELAVELANLPESSMQLATGKAGTVYLCHPFIVHAAQPNYGQTPRFLAQPPLLLKKEIVINSEDKGYNYSPVERAIRTGLGV